MSRPTVAAFVGILALLGVSICYSVVPSSTPAADPGGIKEAPRSGSQPRSAQQPTQTRAGPRPVPPPPMQAAPSVRPRFLMSTEIRMGAEERSRRRAAFAAPGPWAAYRSLPLAEMTEQERAKAQREAMAESRTIREDPSYRSGTDLLRAVHVYQRMVWGAGGGELARWLYERSVDVDGSLSDGLPDPTTMSRLACPLLDAARACAPLGYPRCDAAEDLEAAATRWCQAAP